MRYWARGGDRFLYAYTMNLSAGGVFIATQHPFRKGSRIQIEFAAVAGRFIVDGLVMRSMTYPRELQSMKTSGMGVRFVTVPELIAEALPTDPVELDAPPPTPITLAPPEPGAQAPGADALIGTTPLLDATAAEAEPEDLRTTRAAFRTTRLVARSVGGKTTVTVLDQDSEATYDNRDVDASDEYEYYEEEEELSESGEFDELGDDEYFESEEADAEAKRPARDGDPGSKTGKHQALPRPRDHRVEFETCLDFLAAYNSELRYGRLFLATSDPTPEGSDLNLVLDLPAASRQLRVLARVYYVRRERLGGNPAETGMKVRIDSERDRERIASLAKAAEEMHLALPRT